jgi:hypothetical protein
MKEAHEFARGPLGLEHGRYRVITSASTIKSVRGADLHLVPGWQNRFDRFAVKGAIRWTRMNIVDHADGVQAAPAEDPRGPLTDEVLELAYAEDSIRSGNGAPGIVSESQDEALDALEAAQERGEAVPSDPEGIPVVPEQKTEDKRRRRRCKECGVLIEPDDVESHAATHSKSV